MTCRSKIFAHSMITDVLGHGQNFEKIKLVNIYACNRKSECDKFGETDSLTLRDPSYTTEVPDMATRWWEATLWPPVSMNGHLGICPCRVGCCDLCRHKRWHKRLGSFDEERNYGWPMSLTWRTKISTCKVLWDFKRALRPLWIMSSGKQELYIAWKTWASAVPADALAPAGARASAGTVMTKLGYGTWKGKHSLVLLRFQEVTIKRVNPQS